MQLLVRATPTVSAVPCVHSAWIADQVPIHSQGQACRTTGLHSLQHLQTKPTSNLLRLYLSPLPHSPIKLNFKQTLSVCIIPFILDPVKSLLGLCASQWNAGWWKGLEGHCTWLPENIIALCFSASLRMQAGGCLFGDADFQMSLWVSI